MYRRANLRKKLLIIARSSKIIIKLVALDQLTKWWFMHYLLQTPGLTLKVTNFFSIVHSWNYGISFGLFRSYYQYSNAILIVVNILITIYLWKILINCCTTLSFLGYSCIIGGAIGNIVDRIFKGAVFDFIYLHYWEYGFPVFNLADSFITIGVMVLGYEYKVAKKSVEEKTKKNYDVLAAEAENIRKLDDINLKVK